jgi:hypothetical protein
VVNAEEKSSYNVLGVNEWIRDYYKLRNEMRNELK